MKKNQINILMSLLIVASATIIFLGAIFKLQHWPNGELILHIGLVSNFIFGSIEINRLKRIIKKQDEADPEV